MSFAFFMKGINTASWSLTLIIPARLDPTRFFHLTQSPVYKSRVYPFSVESELFQLIQQGITMSLASLQKKQQAGLQELQNPPALSAPTTSPWLPLVCISSTHYSSAYLANDLKSIDKMSILIGITNKGTIHADILCPLSPSLILRIS